MSIVVGIFRHVISGTTVIRYEGCHLSESPGLGLPQTQSLTTESFRCALDSSLLECWTFSTFQKIEMRRVKQSKKSDVLKVKSQGERSDDGWVDGQWELNCLDYRRCQMLRFKSVDGNAMGARSIVKPYRQ